MSPTTLLFLTPQAYPPSRLASLVAENASIKKKFLKVQATIKAARSYKRDRVPSDSPWQLFQDHNGRNYYYHSVTKDCTYEKPSTWH